MPLWQISHPEGAFSAHDKQTFADDVTAFYTSRLGLPPFYVVTLFQEIPEESFLVGGKTKADTVRIVIEHVAHHIDDPERRRGTGEAFSAIVAPYTVDRGLHVEFHIDETPRDLWMIDGLWPPSAGSDAEKLWVRENRPVPY